MQTIRIQVTLPQDLVRDIDSLVGKRGRAAFLAEIATQEVKRRKLLALLADPEPIWKSEDHPELKNGSAAWVAKTRRADQRIRDRRYTEDSRL